jgi:hypothetical protein
VAILLLEADPAAGALALIICGVLYFLPAIVGRKKRNSSAILWLNFLLGWTVAGWIVAFIWATTKDAPPTQVIVNQPAPASVLCSNCGKYSPPGTRFCSMCGAHITP